MLNMGKVRIEVWGFRCERCRHEWVPRNEQEPRVCPKCKSRAERKFSTFGVAMAPAKSSAAPSPGCATCPSAAGGSCPYH